MENFTEYRTCDVCGGTKLVDPFTGARAHGTAATVEATQTVDNPCTCPRTERHVTGRTHPSERRYQ